MRRSRIFAQRACVSSDEADRLKAERRGRRRQAVLRQDELARALGYRLARARSVGGWTGSILEHLFGRPTVWLIAVSVRWAVRQMYRPGRSGREAPLTGPQCGQAWRNPQELRDDISLALARRRVAILEWRLRLRLAPRRLRSRLTPTNQPTPWEALRVAVAAGLTGRRAAPATMPRITWVVHGTRRELLTHRIVRRIGTSYPAMEVRAVRGGWRAAVAVAGRCEGIVVVSGPVTGHRRDWLTRLVIALHERPDVRAVAPVICRSGKIVGGGRRFALVGGIPVPVVATSSGVVPALDGCCVVLRTGTLASSAPCEAYTGDLWAVDLTAGWTRDGHRLLSVDVAVEAEVAERENDLRILLERNGPWLRRQVATDLLDGAGTWSDPRRPPPSADEKKALRRSLARPSFSLRVAARDRTTALHGGDYYLAAAFARALERIGYWATVELSGEISNLSGACHDVCVEFRGRHRARNRLGQVTILWIISHPDNVPECEISRARLVLVASRAHARELAARHTVPVRPLLQFTDVRQFFHDPDQALRHELLFVGNWRSHLRPVVWAALKTGRDLALYGAGWEFVAERSARGRWVPNTTLRRLYSSSAIVLNDHWPDMRAKGFLSNRLFDALACEAFVLADCVDGLSEDLGDAVETFRDPYDFSRKTDYWLARPAERRRRAERGSELVRRSHTADVRAEQFLCLLEELLGFERI